MKAEDIVVRDANPVFVETEQDAVVNRIKCGTRVQKYYNRAFTNMSCNQEIVSDSQKGQY